MKSYASWSIRTYLLAFIMLAILPSIGLLIHGQMRQRREILLATQRQMQATAEAMGLQEEAMVGNVRQILSSMAHLPALETPDRTRYQLLFDNLLRQNPHLDNIFFADPQGKVLISSGIIGPTHIGDRPYFLHVLKQRHPFSGGYTLSRGSLRQVMPVAYPVEDPQGGLQGVLVAGIALDGIKTATWNGNGDTEAVLEVLDYQGRLLHSSAGPQRFRGDYEAPGYLEQLIRGGARSSFKQVQNGKTYLHSIRRLELNPDGQEPAWLRISIPEESLLRQVKNDLWRSLTVMGALTLGLFVLAWWVGSALIAAPLDRLVTVAQRMAQGGFTVKTGLIDSNREVSRLAASFEQLGVRLELRERELRQAMAQSEEVASRFQKLEEHIPDGVFWLRVLPGAHFIYETVNPAFERINAITKAEIQGRGPEEVFPAEHAQSALTHFRQCLSAAKPSRTQRVVSQNEVKRTLNIQLIPIRDACGEIHRMVGFCQDITEAQAAEEALRQSQKLKSLGILAGGIAHDFNNLLTAILGNLNLAQVKLGSQSPAVNYLDNIERTVVRASDLTRQLLAYSGRGHFVVKPMDLSGVVREMTHLLEVSIPKKIRLDYRFAGSLPLIEADYAQVQQVVMNLVTNASDAIGEREGIIGITTRCIEINKGFISATFPDQAIEPGLFVILEVSDNGCGMSRKVLDRIFDPFFTTKSTGKGLGLSAMLGILRGHRAGIKIYSEVNRGTVFKLFFPAAQGAVLPPDYISPSLPIQVEGTILVVDDEADIRETACIALENLGFTVITAADGREAVEVFQTYQKEIRAVLMDLTMPHLDGKEAFRQIRALDPRACVILSSGYSEQDICASFEGEGPNGFIQKPYHIKEMQRVLVDCLQLRVKTTPR